MHVGNLVHFGTQTDNAQTGKFLALQGNLMKPIVLRRIIAGFVLTAVILGGAGVLLYRVAMQFRENRESVVHAREVLETLRGLSTSLEDAQTAVRVYVLTGDSS